MFLFQDENRLTRENDRSRHSHSHTHTQFTAPAAHIQAEKKRVKEEGNERRSLNDVVWSIKKKM